jgi:type I restriction enzyme M protein
MAARSANHDGPNGAALFEAANKLRGSVESSEYKHLVLGLLFLKYISDAFEQRRQTLEAELSDPKGKDTSRTRPSVRLSSRIATPIFEKEASWVPERVPESARWPALLAVAACADIAKRIDDALSAIERENPGRRNVLPRIYAGAPLSLS